MNLNGKPFIIPKAPMNQMKHNDLASLLAIQPKNLRELDDVQKSTFNHTNNQDDTMKSYLSGLLEIMKSQIGEYGNIAFEMKKNLADKPDTTTSQITQKNFEEFVHKSEAKFKDIFDKLNNFDLMLNNMNLSQENLFNRLNTKIERLCEEMRYKSMEQTNLLETSTDQIIEMLNKKVLTESSKTYVEMAKFNDTPDSVDSRNSDKKRVLIDNHEKFVYQNKRKLNYKFEINKQISGIKKAKSSFDEDDDDDDYGYRHYKNESNYNNHNSDYNNELDESPDETDNEDEDDDDDEDDNNSSVLFIFNQ